MQDKKIMLIMLKTMLEKKLISKEVYQKSIELVNDKTAKNNVPNLKYFSCIY